jgi:hypothetical protein
VRHHYLWSTTEVYDSMLDHVASLLDSTGWVLGHYLKRMHVEESFRDDKSGSLDLHASHLTDAKRLDTLLLAIAIAVLWINQRGEHLLREERRKEIDPRTAASSACFNLVGACFAGF